MDQSNTESSPNFLDDSPALEDEFGGHHRLANAITKTLSEQRDGKGIAIQGSWGSGKSTVIGFVKVKLEKNHP